MCADPEQHRIKVSHHGTYGDPHHRMERPSRVLFHFLGVLNTTTQAYAWVPMAQWLGPVIWGLRPVLVLSELIYQKG